MAGEASRQASAASRRRDEPVTRAVGRHLGALLHDRLSALGLTTKDFLAILPAGTFATSDESNQGRTLKAWLAGERTAPRSVLAVAAGLDPSDPDLLDACDRLERLLDPNQFETSPSALALDLALHLDRGLDDPPEASNIDEPKRSSTSTTSEIWRWATYLLNAAAARAKPGTIVIDARGFEAVDHHAKEWRRAMWRAIRAKWHVRHVLSWGPPATMQLEDSVQVELVINSLYSAAVDGRYEPVIWSPTPSANVIAVEGVGALSIWHHPTQPGKRYAYLEKGGKGLASHMTARDEPVSSRFSVPTIALASDHYTGLRFVMALAAAEADPDAEHCMIKGGIPTTVVDRELTALQEDAWRAEEPQLAPYIDLHHDVRERRWKAFEHLTARPARSRSGRYRDIITSEGVQRYINDGDPGGGVFGGKYLTVPQRITQTRRLADLIERRSGYSLALVDRRELLTPVDKNWWAAVRGGGRESRAVFFVASRQELDGVKDRMGWLSGSGSTSTVEAFFSLFELMWAMLPPASRDAGTVATRLRALAADAERAAHS